MKTVGVRELKARLSSFLREVAAGELVLVTDRGRVVAELRPPGKDVVQGGSLAERRQRLVERGLLAPGAEVGRGRLDSLPTLRLGDGTARGLVDAERKE